MRMILMALGLLLVAACGDSYTPEQHVARAREYIAAEDYGAAAIELQNALRLAGNSAEARALLGQTQLLAGDVAAAEAELQRAQDLGWNADEVRPALAEALLAQGKFADALQLDHQALAPAAAAHLLATQSMAALSAGQVEKARELAALAKAQDPQSLEAKLAEATIAVHLDDATDALTLVEPIIQAAPEEGEAWWLKGQALSRQGKFEEARAALDKSVALADTSPGYRIARALVNVQLQDYEAAQADVAELLEVFPRNPAVNYVQGLLQFEAQQYRKAIAALRLAEPAAQQFPLTLFFLGSAYLHENDLKLAAKYTQRFVDVAPNEVRGLKMLAAILLLQDKTEEAQRMLQPVLDQNPNDPAALNIAANALLREDQADLGLVLYARIRQLQPEWPIAPLGQEAALVLAGPRDAGEPFATAAAPGGDNFPQADVLKILDAMQAKDFTRAEDAAKSFQFRALGSLAPYRILGMIYLAAGQPDSARDQFERVLQQAPGDPVANQGLAQLALSADDAATAREYYQATLHTHPDDLTTLLQLAALEAKVNNPQGMIARLNQAMEAHPTVLEPRLSLAHHYLSTGAPDKVEGLFAPLSELQRRAPRALDVVGRAQLTLKQTDKALVTLRQLVEATPGSADAHYLLAMAASESGDLQTARRELNAGAAQDPKHLPSLVGLAKLARLEGRQQDFEQYVATLVELAPDTADVLRLRALAAQLAGQPGDAVGYALAAFRKAPSTQTLLELSALQRATGDAEEARKTLRNWISAAPTDVAVRLALANDLEAGGNVKAAQAQYLAVLNLEPGNVTALNNLAWNLRRDDPKRALEYIRQAVAIAPDLPVLLDTLAVVESLNGDHRSAQRNMERALAAAPEDVSLRYHQAMLAAARGETAQAIAALEALLAKPADNFPERAEAEALLRSLKG